MNDAPSELSLQINSISKAYGDFVAVDDLSLSVPAGTIFGLLGPNGAGKTTTIRMIMDIIAPDTGEVLFQGRPRTERDLHRIGYLPEERGLYRKMTVIEQLTFLGELHGLTRAVATTRAQEWLERVDLADWTRKKLEELSKGMQQKIQLIGTILHEPDLVVLDEPFSGLDPINQELFKETLARFRREGKTVLFSTHIMEQAEKLCDHLCLISRGKAVLDGSLADIQRRFGGGTYSLRADVDAATLEALDDVRGCSEHDGRWLVRLAEGADPADLLTRLVEQGVRVRELASREPDLEEIFIRAVRQAEAALPA